MACRDVRGRVCVSVCVSVCLCLCLCVCVCLCVFLASSLAESTMHVRRSIHFPFPRSPCAFASVSG